MATQSVPLFERQQEEAPDDGESPSDADNNCADDGDGNAYNSEDEDDHEDYEEEEEEESPWSLDAWSFVRPVPPVTQAGAEGGSNSQDPPGLVHNNMPRPPELVAVAVLLGLCGAGAALLAAGVIKDALPLFNGGSVGRGFAVFAVLMATIFGATGLGLLAVAWLLVTGDRVGRILGVAVCSAVGLAAALVQPRTTSSWLLIGGAAASGLTLIVPERVRDYFHHEDPRPGGVVGGSAIISLIAWGFAVSGVASLALRSYASHFTVDGALLLGGSLLLLIANARLRAGDAAARAVASLVLMGLAALALAETSRSDGSIVLAALAGGALAMLWLPERSAAFFRGELPWAYAGSWFAWPWTNRDSSPANGALRRRPSLIGMTALGGAAVLVLITTTGGSSVVSDQNNIVDPFPTYRSPSPPTYPSNSSFSHSWVLTATAAGGYSMTARIDVGDPEHFSTSVTNGLASPGSCNLDPQTDAIIPARITITNTTPNFSAYSGLTIDGIGSGVYWEAHYNEGNSCAGQGDGNTSFGMTSTAPLVSGTSSVVYGFFDITGLYSPDEPNGDASALAGSVLTIPDSYPVNPNSSSYNSENSTEYTVTAVTGPGVSNVDSGWQFALNGAARAPRS